LIPHFSEYSKIQLRANFHFSKINLQRIETTQRIKDFLMKSVGFSFGESFKRNLPQEDCFYPLGI